MRIIEASGNDGYFETSTKNFQEEFWSTQKFEVEKENGSVFEIFLASSLCLFAILVGIGLLLKYVFWRLKKRNEGSYELQKELPERNRLIKFDGSLFNRRSIIY